MRILKESILNRSSHTGEGFKTQRREMIESWLNKYDIRNYTINDDFTVDVSEDLYLELKDLTEFPEYIQFGIVKGYFDCEFNRLISLKGAPKRVDGNFYCSHNKLTTLKGAPETVGGSFYCSNNRVQFTEEDVRKVCKVEGRISVK